MEFTGFIGSSYTLRSRKADLQRTVNLYLEPNEQGGRPALIHTPGLDLVATAGNGPCRGMFTSSKGRSFMVSGNGLYEITYPEAPSLLGTLSTSGGPVSMADNGVDLLVVDGVSGYTFRFVTDVFAAVADVDFPNAQYVAFLDQYLIVNDAGTGNFFLSALSDATNWDGLDFAAAEGYPDKLESLLVSNRDLVLFGTQSTEYWRDTGNINFPLERIDGAFVEYGTAAPAAMLKVDNGIIGPMQDKNGSALIMRINGYQPQRVSTFAVEFALKSATDLHSATAWTCQEAGHTFYCLNAPGLTSTWCYDVATGQWHERQSFNTSTNSEDRHRGEFHCVIDGLHYVGDYENGNIYELSDAIYQDNGQHIARIRPNRKL